MRHPHLVFHQGNAFTFQPDQPVDWLLCDVIAAPSRSIELLMKWVRQRWARRFVVTEATIVVKLVSVEASNTNPSAVAVVGARGTAFQPAAAVVDEAEQSRVACRAGSRLILTPPTG
jgi:hypothetical protein